MIQGSELVGVRPAVPSAASGERIARDGFLQVNLAGTPFEMGVQHGELLRYEIRDLIDAVYHHVLHGQPGIVGWGIRRAARTAAALMGAYIPSRYRAELKGIARAADVSYADLVLLNCFDDVLANLRLLGAMFGRLGCSVFAISADRSASGELVCGRNLDYFVAGAVSDEEWAATNYMKEHLVAFHCAPRDRATFVAVGWPGFVGTATGLSDRGMAVASLTVRTLVNLPAATPASFLYRRVMEEAGSLGEAVTILRAARRTQANNVLLGSGGEGTAAVAEYTPWRMAVRHPEDGWIVATNHFNHPDMLRRNPRRRYESSWDRCARLGELCASDGSAADWEGLRGFLMDTHLHRPEATEYCRVLNPCTVLSTLFAPGSSRLWVRATDRPDRCFEEIMLGRE